MVQSVVNGFYRPTQPSPFQIEQQMSHILHIVSSFFPLYYFNTAIY